ncbi:hypothetical protein [Novipirellula artificiosorum]|uniref:hypothetical protein n=1 Tax=Novipirellula artificiosorum TaxID=2528016 RepID=UPI0011B5843D|nr:hypothetical protein [Novipirellula artificiosorum]
MTLVVAVVTSNTAAEPDSWDEFAVAMSDQEPPSDAAENKLMDKPMSLDWPPVPADFRSTKHNVHSARLTDNHGVGIELVSDGDQHSRCYVDGDSIQWLIAEVDNGPSETFMSGYFDPKRKPVPLGQAVQGEIRLRSV